MTEQNPRASIEDEDDRTVFQPGPRPPVDLTSAIAPPHAEAAADHRTIIRPAAHLRRPGSPLGDTRADPGSAPPPRRSAVQSLGLEAANENPLLRAAAPLLLLLGRLRTSLLRATDTSLAAQIAADIEAFERELRAADLDAEDIRTAKFVLCVTADEVLANLPRGDLDVTPRSGFLTRIFGESDGTRKFLDEIDRVREDPEHRFYMLELFHACLALCFQGGTTSLLGGPATLQDLRQNLHELLQQVRSARELPLSPRWEGQPLPSQATHVRVPLWAAASFVGLILVTTFVGLRILLGGHAEAVATTLLDLNPPTPVEIRKGSVPPPMPPTPTAAQVSQLEHIRKVLTPSIAAGALVVQASPNNIVIQVAEKALFLPDKASILDEARPLVMLVAYALDDEKGPIKVVGHSDTSSLVSARFASSFELSQERARSVASLLEKSLSNPTRVSAEGRGADAPIAANDTPEGRSKNRRIDIVIPRSD